MKDVNDLKKTSETMGNEFNQAVPQTQPTISLSTLVNENQGSNAVNINAVNGLTGINEDTVKKLSTATINIAPRRIHKHRSTNDASASSLKQVNPNDYIEPPAPPKTETIQDRAIGLLAKAVKEKREEYKQFVDYALEQDAINREQVEAGLETVGEEIQYMPDNLHVPMAEEEKVTSEFNDVNDIISGSLPSEFMDDDFEYEDADNNNISDVSEVSQVHIEDPFSDLVIHPAEEKSVIKPKVKEEDAEIITAHENEAKEETSEEEKEEESKDEYSSILSNSINLTTSALDNPISNASSTDFELSEEDLEGIPTTTIDPEESLSDEEILKITEASEKNLKSEILQKIIQTGKNMNTSQFVVSNKVINLQEAIKNIPGFSKKTERTAIWPLTFAGRPFKASALKGPEIALLADSDNSDSDRSVGLTVEQAKILFDHDASPYRPSSLESWAKTIPFSDVENIFAALYVASLKGANYIPMACPTLSCQHAYLSEDIKIEQMLKFSNDEAKQRFEDIKNVELTPENTGSYESVLNVINDKFAVAIKLPSIFTMLYEYGSVLGTDFFRKYKTMVSVIQYIDYIYYIDENTSQFQPIGWKTYFGDHSKSFKSKIATYSKILKEFDDTDFTVLLALISSLVNKMMDSRGISFEIPEAKCPKCGSKIDARTINARGLVFVRQRLVELATTRSER